MNGGPSGRGQRVRNRPDELAAVGEHLGHDVDVLAAPRRIDGAKAAMLDDQLVALALAAEREQIARAKIEASAAPALPVAPDAPTRRS